MNLPENQVENPKEVSKIKIKKKQCRECPTTPSPKFNYKPKLLAPIETLKIPKSISRNVNPKEYKPGSIQNLRWI